MGSLLNISHKAKQGYLKQSFIENKSINYFDSTLKKKFKVRYYRRYQRTLKFRFQIALIWSHK